MIRTWIDRAVVPLLFVVVASAVALYALSAAGVARGEEEQAESQTAETVEATEAQYSISAYDDIFKEVGAEWGVDWLLLAAIARSESEFRYDVVSPSGAVGLMQVMPYVAKNMGVARDELFDPRRNVEVAAELLTSIEKMFRFNESFDEKERLYFILAAYNAGYARVGDARRLARHHGEDDKKWSVVSTYLVKLCDEEYFNLTVVKYGSFCGSDETIAYVNKVVHIYNCYHSGLFAI